MKPSLHRASLSRSAPRRACLLVGILALAGCTSASPQYATDYPFALKQDATLDIQVVRVAQRITLTNTTATNFGPSRLWLNRRFSRPIDQWAIGQTLDFHLGEFVDEFGQRFRAGGFFAAEAPDKLVHAQIESPRLEDVQSLDDARVLGLIVVPASD
jgi:hypothetical protein